jgi:hypothetical protein
MNPIKPWAKMSQFSAKNRRNGYPLSIHLEFLWIIQLKVTGQRKNRKELYSK